MSLSIIIVNFKTPQLLADCLKSVYNQELPEEYEVIVVDNASGDDSRQQITSAFPKVSWIQMDYNAGFARANNAGIRMASGETVLLLNSDTINENDAIGKTYRLFKDAPFVACGVQLVYADHSPQISGNYFMKGGLNNLLPLPYVGAALRELGKLFGIEKPHVPDSDDVVEVDWINGAFLMVKKAAIARAGMLDEDFFLYAEEAEWCHRLGKYGRMAIYGQFNVIHLQGKTSNTAFQSTGQGYYNLYDKKGLQIMLSNFVRIRKQYGPAWFFFHLLMYTVTIPVYILFHLISIFYAPGKFLNGFTLLGGFSKNVMTLWSYLFRVLANKPFFYKVI